MSKNRKVIIEDRLKKHLTVLDSSETEELLKKSYKAVVYYCDQNPDNKELVKEILTDWDILEDFKKEFSEDYFDIVTSPGGSAADKSWVGHIKLEDYKNFSKNQSGNEL